MQTELSRQHHRHMPVHWKTNCQWNIRQLMYGMQQAKRRNKGKNKGPIMTPCLTPFVTRKLCDCAPHHKTRSCHYKCDNNFLTVHFTDVRSDCRLSQLNEGLQVAKSRWCNKYCGCFHFDRNGRTLPQASKVINHTALHCCACCDVWQFEISDIPYFLFLNVDFLFFCQWERSFKWSPRSRRNMKKSNSRKGMSTLDRLNSEKIMKVD